MKNNTFEEIWDCLKGCKRVAMTLHVSPDGDSMGSSCAMKYVLEREFGTNVTLVSGDPISDNLMELPFAPEIDFTKDFSDLDPNDFDAYLFIDTGATSRLSSKLKDSYQIPEILTIDIDHHHTNAHYGKLNYIDGHKPSSCSVLLEMFKHLGVEIDVELANRLLLGICTDSGFFNFSTPALIEAAYLVEKGADYRGLMVEKVRFNTTLRNKRYIAQIIDNTVDMGGYGYSYMSYEDVQKFGLNETELRSAIWAIEDVKEFDFLFTVIELKDRVKGSFRSRKGVDTSLFATALGGGGHKYSCAFVLPKMPIEEAVKKVLEVIEKVGIHRY